MSIAETVLPPPGKQRPRIPEWLRLRLPTSSTFAQTANLIGDLRLHTVCESARCPNHWECWSKGTATFMIAGDRCTRACGFCAVSTARPLPLEADEPQRVAEAVRAANPGIVLEVLVPDFLDRDESIDTVLAAEPHIYNHNLETVRRLTPSVRHRATYDRSLSVLRKVKAKRGDSIYTKSGLMLGLGEREEELFVAMEDLRRAQCDLLTLGQYLQPTLRHLPVVEFIPPAKFKQYGERAREMGFTHVASGPMVRSSYHADDFSPELASGRLFE